MPCARVGERLAPDDLAVADEFLQQDAVAGPGSAGGASQIRSVTASPEADRSRTAHLRPPRPGLPTERLATGCSAR